MASSKNLLSKGEFQDLLDLLSPCIANHPIVGFDLMLSMWLDPTGTLSLSNKYREWRDCPLNGLSKPGEIRARYLLQLWKEGIGQRSATYDSFKALIIGKEYTAGILEKIDIRNSLDIDPKESHQSHINVSCVSEANESKNKDVQKFNRSLWLDSMQPFQYPCPKCIKMVTWYNPTGQGLDITVKCSCCQIMGTMYNKVCQGCSQNQYLYPSMCASCMSYPAQVYQVEAGQKFDHGGLKFTVKTGPVIVMVTKSQIYVCARELNVLITDNSSLVTVTFGIPC